MGTKKKSKDVKGKGVENSGFESNLNCGKGELELYRGDAYQTARMESH